MIHIRCIYNNKKGINRTLSIYILAYELLLFFFGKIVSTSTFANTLDKLSDIHQQYLLSCLKYVSVNNWNYTEYKEVLRGDHMALNNNHSFHIVVFILDKLCIWRKSENRYSCFVQRWQYERFHSIT